MPRGQAFQSCGRPDEAAAEGLQAGPKEAREENEAQEKRQPSALKSARDSQDKTCRPSHKPRKPRGRRHPFLGPTEAAGAVDVALDPVEFTGQAQAAGCTEMEIQAVLLWVECRSMAEVADTLGLSRRKVRVMFLSVLDKMKRYRARHRPRMTSAQIRAVYAEEVNRFGYTGEHHCRPGEEACRHDGLCKRRWYLFGEEAL